MPRPPRQALGHPRPQQADYWLSSAPKLAGGSYLLRDFRHESREPHWHQHHEFELIHFLSGRGIAYVGDTVIPFVPGDCLLLGAKLPHGWKRQSPGPRTLHTRVLHFRPAIFGSLFEVNHELSALPLLLGRASAGLKLGGRARAMATRFLAEAFRWTPGDARRVCGLLALLADLAVSLEKPGMLSPVSTVPAPRAPGADAIFDQVLGHLDAHYGEALRQKELAALCHFKPAAFSRWFSRRSGMPLSRYLSELRLAHAARFLIQGANPISEIASDCGFASLTHFYRVFHARYGKTPADFREWARRFEDRPAIRTPSSPSL